MIGQTTNCLSYYDLERYLFDTVSSRFAKDRELSAFDFFCIVIWKANRSKSTIAKRLLAHGKYSNLDGAVRELTSAIANAASPKERLRVLIADWKFLLPMASAILAVLYPDEFTVYDIRVCEQLGDFQWVQNRSKFDNLWNGYGKYVAAVNVAAPTSLQLRDKDRWLWGRSFSEQLRRDIAANFAPREQK